jgi:hypothetical protein
VLALPFEWVTASATWTSADVPLVILLFGIVFRLAATVQLIGCSSPVGVAGFLLHRDKNLNLPVI